MSSSSQRDNRKRKAYVTRDELVKMLRRDKGREGLKTYGQRIGVSATLVGSILRGERDPGPKVAAYFGFPVQGYLRRRRA
jgi:hypothetical protein